MTPSYRTARKRVGYRNQHGGRVGWEYAVYATFLPLPPGWRWV